MGETGTHAEMRLGAETRDIHKINPTKKIIETKMIIDATIKGKKKGHKIKLK